MANKEVRDARHEQEQLEAMHRLDEECVHLQRAGNYLQAFDNMERALVLRRHCFGADSPEVTHACRALAEMCNLLSMSFLQQDNFPVTLELLKKAEILAKKHPKENATTLNNLACYYRRLGKLHTAMTCLNKALAIETKTLRDPRNAADTHLNICAVLSQLGKHQQALDHAQAALLTLQEEFFQKPHKMSSEESPSTSTSQQLERVSVMCIAYHNVGVEQEFLKDYDGCVLSYKKGVGLAEQYLGVDHAIATTIRNSYLAAKRTISTKASHHPRSPVGGAKSGAAASASRVARVATPPSSLRLPSPITKPKTQPKQQQPRVQEQLPSLSPRSIVADALARGNTLPPLEQNKNKNKTNTLTPEDPFFSPRFQFDTRTKMKNKNKDENKNETTNETNAKTPRREVVDAHEMGAAEQTTVLGEQESERNTNLDVASPEDSGDQSPVTPPEETSSADLVEVSSAGETSGVGEVEVEAEAEDCVPEQDVDRSARPVEASPATTLVEDTLNTDSYSPRRDKKETDELLIHDDEVANEQEREEVGGEGLVAEDGGDAPVPAATATVVVADVEEPVVVADAVAETTLVVEAPAAEAGLRDQHQQLGTDEDKDKGSHLLLTEEKPLEVVAVVGEAGKQVPRETEEEDDEEEKPSPQEKEGKEEEEQKPSPQEKEKEEEEEEKPSPQEKEEDEEKPSPQEKEEEGEDEEKAAATNGERDVTETDGRHADETETETESETGALVVPVAVDENDAASAVTVEEGAPDGGDSDTPAPDMAVAWQTQDETTAYADEATAPWDGSHDATGAVSDESAVDPYAYYAHHEYYAHTDDHAYVQTDVVSPVDSSCLPQTEVHVLEGDPNELPEVQQHEWQDQDWQSTASHDIAMADDGSAWQPLQEQPLTEEDGLQQTQQPYGDRQ